MLATEIYIYIYIGDVLEYPSRGDKVRYHLYGGKIEHAYECVCFFSVVETSLMIHKTIIGDVSECSSLRDISATSDTTYTSIISTEEKNTIIIFN